jgi:anti-sigma regulatory factor (Ser/Thr protein kinase)
LEVSLHNQASEIPHAHAALDRFAADHGLPAPVVRAFHLALEEHLTNSISYGFTQGRVGTIHVRFTVDHPNVCVEVEDDADPFNPLTAPEPDTSLPLDAKPLGGLGLLLIRKSMDQVEYRQANGHNVLVMRKRLG